MNYCRRCQSDYEKPGTCNCFAEGGDAKPADTKPWTPAPTWTPAVPYPVYPWWYGSGWWGIYPPLTVPYVQTFETTDPVETTITVWDGNTCTTRIENVPGRASYTTVVQ